jgi:hypothetical protein
LFYITSGASQAVPESACVEANRTACVELYCSSVHSLFFGTFQPLIEGSYLYCGSSYFKASYARLYFNAISSIR